MKTIDKNVLIKKYHTLCHVKGLRQDEKAALLAAYGVESSKQLSAGQLSDLIEKLEGDCESWRRKVMAAIGGWLRSVNCSEGADKIKGIACRAAGCDNFNNIPVSRLRDLYYEFSKKAKTVKNIDLITSTEIGLQSLLN